eukprot:TRINITY_DN64968_c0_g1_i1.p3 TRINITY_DN64968_c0_g1~~TRINITY_DN64968_c0_g1_i1.p3  ORF type:complete len:127 (+),score=5.42 TRINITY_DN64968_c0_g1_i1:45-425(+)
MRLTASCACDHRDRSMCWFCVFFFNDTATTEIYTRSIVGSVRCVQETGTWEQYQSITDPENKDYILANPDYAGFITYTMFTADLPKQQIDCTVLCVILSQPLSTTINVVRISLQFCYKLSWCCWLD